MTREAFIKNILCPIDFSEYSRATLGEALELAEKLGAEIIILHVVNERLYEDVKRLGGRMTAFNGAIDEAISAAEDERAERLKKLLSEVNAGRAAHRSRIAVGIPWESILKTADEEDVDLIVMGARGRGSLARQLRFGTTAEKVFRRAGRRVMFIR